MSFAHEVIVHDKRLYGGSPSSNGNRTILLTSEKTPLSRLVNAINTISLQHGNQIRVKIWCHGRYSREHGGYGLQLCRNPGLTLDTVEQLRPLRNNLSYSIWIYACGAADVAPGRRGKIGDGRFLCSRIAEITATGVRAADAEQTYGPWAWGIDFGSWQGNVLYFDALGKLVQIEHEPDE
jgi:hypothetical protein